MSASRLGAVVVAFVSLAGCNIGFGPAEGQHTPADPVALAFYMRNASQLPYYFVIHGEHQPAIEGPVQPRPASTGCGRVGRDWELVVTQSPTRPEADAPVVERTSGDVFGGPDIMELWLSIEPNGTVTTGEGVPEWWDADIQRCP